MLNGKYIIVGEDYAPVVNRHAFGNVWFVDSLVRAETPDDEIAAIGEVDLHTTAVIGDDFGWAQESFPACSIAAGEDINGYYPEQAGETAADGDFIEMTHYAPNELRYSYRTGRDRAVIFSEIYYPSGWTLTWTAAARTGSGGEPAASELPLFRADWLLRGAILPAGEGELVMRFDPPSYRTGEVLSRASSITLLLLLVLSAGGLALTERKQD